MTPLCPVCRQPGCPHWELRRQETWHPPVEVRAELTPREVEVLRLIADGLPHKTVAAQLFVSTNTINSHTDEIRRKLDARNMPHAIARAFTAGILP